MTSSAGQATRRERLSRGIDPLGETFVPSSFVKAEAEWPEAKIPTFAGYAGETSAESDELDIPAFLRRSH